MQDAGAGAESLCLVMSRTLRVWESGCACEALALITTCESAMMEKCLSLKMQPHLGGKDGVQELHQSEEGSNIRT